MSEQRKCQRHAVAGRVEVGVHILVVDADPGSREAVASALGEAYTVHGAATGAEAIQHLRSRPIAVILLEPVLGREDGFAFVDRFRLLSPAPLLVLTGHSTEALIIRAIRVPDCEFPARWGERLHASGFRGRIGEGVEIPPP